MCLDSEKVKENIRVKANTLLRSDAERGKRYHKQFVIQKC